jgi:penicillin-binding protein 1C
MPTIVTPARGTRIAIDPDIPPSHQRVTFEARDAPIDVRWVLDEVEIGGGSLLLRAPRPGRHALALVDADGRVRDTTIFDVRGPASAD